MEERIKNIFGNKKITDINTFVLIEKKDEISIYYENKEIVLAVYGRIFCSTPHKVIDIKLKEYINEFSTEEDVVNYINTGVPDAKLSRQKEIITICLFGDKIKKKVNELELQIKRGKTIIELKCPSDYIVAVENYAKKKHLLKATKRGSSIVLSTVENYNQRKSSTDQRKSSSDQFDQRKSSLNN